MVQKEQVDKDSIKKLHTIGKLFPLYIVKILVKILN